MAKRKLVLSLVICLWSQSILLAENKCVIVDSQLQFPEALGDTSIVPPEIIKNLCLVDVTYYSFDGRLHLGQIVLHKDIVIDVIELFQLVKANRFPVAKVIPVAQYHGSDESSMADNNTSGFNYRTIKGSKRLSAHAFGRAIDINPFNNPFVTKNEIRPKRAFYDPGKPGTLTADSPIVIALKKRGWIWGGDWRTSKDYQHFEKKGSRH